MLFIFTIPYKGSKTLLHVFDRFDDAALIAELLEGMYEELPERKPKNPDKTYNSCLPM